MINRTESQQTDFDGFSLLDDGIGDGFDSDFFGWEQRAHREASNHRSTAVKESSDMDSLIYSELTKIISQLGSSNHEKRAEAYRQLLRYLECDPSSRLNNLACVLMNYLGEDDSIGGHTTRAINEIASRSGKSRHDNQSLLLLVGPPPRAAS